MKSSKQCRPPIRKRLPGSRSQTAERQPPSLALRIPGRSRQSAMTFNPRAHPQKRPRPRRPSRPGRNTSYQLGLANMFYIKSAAGRKHLANRRPSQTLYFECDRLYVSCFADGGLAESVSSNRDDSGSALEIIVGGER
jgi:hypothetical protein